jgi:NAD(P)H dehydrogenase (quinone)
MASIPSTILVTGASGHLGRLIVSELLSFNEEGGEGYNIIASSRNPSSLAELSSIGAELRLLDLDNYELTLSAFQGVDTVVLVSTKEFQKRILQHRTAIRAAEAAGVKHLVYTSYVNPKPQEGLFNDHFFTENDIVASRLKWTILRNNCYSETLFLTLPAFLDMGVLPTAAGFGKRSYICRLDCASMAAAVALNASRYDHRVFDVGGSESLSAPDLAAMVTKVTERPLNVDHVSVTEYVSRLEHIKAPKWWINIATDVENATAAGAMAIINAGIFKQVVGREPISLNMFLQTNRAHFMGITPPATQQTI